MIKSFLKFFVKKHLLTNLIFIAVIIGGIISWQLLKKEELPDITFDRVTVSVSYPGATAEEVEYYVTKEIEERIQAVDGVYRVTSATSDGSSSVTAELELNISNKEEVITEIRNAALEADLPEDIIDDPKVRVFKTAYKAIIDIGLIYRGKTILDTESRRQLQAFALALENQLVSIPQVSSVNRSGYLDEELQIKVFPEKLVEYNIPLNKVMNEITNSNVRQPAGNIENKDEPKVTLSAELRTPEELRQLAVQGGFEGQVIRLGDVAQVSEGFEKNKQVLKINGHEGIFLNVVKSARYGILDALKAVRVVADDFSKHNLKENKIELVILDDESVDIRNRLSLIATNGAIGFILVLLSLFIFLDFRSSIWVAMGIPFTFCFTLITALLLGYSINNITLAAVIIVMGMVVDDAIVVAENVSRLRAQGMDKEESAVKGTAYVLLPVIASISTTCIAFVPLLFFTGHFSLMVRFIPVIVCLMLGGSLLESLVILPGHLTVPFGRKVKTIISLGLWPLFERFTDKNKKQQSGHWFNKWEDAYGDFIEKILSHKRVIFILFLILLVVSAFVVNTQMKFIMFPDEETRSIRLTADTATGMKRYETARMSQAPEDMLAEYIGKEVVGFRNQIASGRRGSSSQENKLRMEIEITSKEKRKKSADQLIKEWEERFTKISGFQKVKFSKGWHGADSGSPIEIIVKENNNQLRREVSDRLAAEMEKHPALKNIEIDRPMYNPEYKISLDRDKIRRLAINPSDIAKTLRAALEGKVLYDFSGDEEPINVRLTTVENAKDNLDKILSIPVENQGDYLVPLRDIVSVSETTTPDSIMRQEQKRTTTIFADLRQETGNTPLDIAKDFEEKIFPQFKTDFPSAVLEFGGEIKDTRESGKDFQLAIILVIALIYVLLAVLFDSLLKPIVIMLSIPFGLVGIILAFWMHGITQYGFFAVVGALGLAGVVINDAIIMVVKLERELKQADLGKELNSRIAQIAKTRLRAVILTTITTVAAMLPTAYGWAGYDGMLAQMMLAMSWGLLFGTTITLILVPSIYAVIKELHLKL
ncbi:MAG: efflux RND transporter permease subunit [Candidatus Omnitrophota bacterium]